MKVEINNPLQLCIEVVKLDERMPSMRVQVAMESVQFGHTLRYQGYMWLDCATWDTFVLDLRRLDEGGAELKDMGRHFTLQIKMTSEKPTLVWRFENKAVAGDAASAEFRAHLDEDELGSIRDQFAQFERWWSL
ncbi:conserved protein of unknown function [Pararobbsia alpina]|uniref:hypothetical protein n=1 Tax=Pararobbsia alpina TaxID=621374 RepID=UPI0039A578B8